MKWQQHSNDNGFYRLDVEAGWSELTADYDDIVAEYVKVRIPGFRPGKVPRSVVERRFQGEISDDLSRRIVQRFGREAIQEAGIKVLGPAEAEEVECKKGQSFRARLCFYQRPEIDLPEISSLKIDADGSDPHDQVSHHLLDMVTFEIPDRVIKDDLTLAGSDNCEAGSEEWQAASDRIKLMLILKQIAQQEGIEVDKVDVNDRIAEKAVEFGTTKKSLQTELEKGGGVKRLRDMLLAESTLDYLIEQNA